MPIFRTFFAMVFIILIALMLWTASNPDCSSAASPAWSDLCDQLEQMKN